jgi:hypothetical protein
MHQGRDGERNTEVERDPDLQVEPVRKEMSSFNRLEQPQLPCYLCGEFAGPMVDTKIIDVVRGPVYICGPNEARPGCITQLARLFGMIGKDERDALRADLEEANWRIGTLEETQTITVPLGEFRSWMQASGNFTLTPSGSLFE